MSLSLRPKRPVSVPSLAELCQDTVLDFLERSEYHPRLINEVAKRLTLLEHLLEPILKALVSRNAVTDVAFLAFLSPGRHSLDIPGLSGIRNSTLKLIGYNCSGLVTLDASNCSQMSNSIVRCVLQGCAALKVLCLDGCPKISDAAFDPHHSPFERLKAAESLQTISLKRCGQITGAFAAILQKFYRSLICMDLSQCKHIVSHSVHELLTHSSLQQLYLSFVECIGDESFPLLNCELAGSPFPPLSLQSSSPITSLSLGQSRITDQSLLYLANRMQHLSILRLQWCGGITDLGIQTIVTQCSRMKVLDLQSCSITDESLICISMFCSALEELDISWCVSVTDTGIKALGAANSFGKLFDFTTLNVTWCSLISDESIVDLTYLKSFKLFESSSYVMSDECRQKLEQSGVDVRTEIVPSLS
jgi:hypothetical protein